MGRGNALRRLFRIHHLLCLGSVQGKRTLVADPVVDSDSRSGEHRHVALRADPTLPLEARGASGGDSTAMTGQLTLVFIGAATVAALMLVLWFIHLGTGNAAIVDAGWAGGLAILGVLYAALGGGYWLRSAILGTMAGLWGLRLAVYLVATRVIGHPEEGRYQEL